MIDVRRGGLNGGPTRSHSSDFNHIGAGAKLNNHPDTQSQSQQHAVANPANPADPLAGLDHHRVRFDANNNDDLPAMIQAMQNEHPNEGPWNALHLQQ